MLIDEKRRETYKNHSKEMLVDSYIELNDTLVEIMNDLGMTHGFCNCKWKEELLSRIKDLKALDEALHENDANIPERIGIKEPEPSEVELEKKLAKLQCPKCGKRLNYQKHVGGFIEDDEVFTCSCGWYLRR